MIGERVGVHRADDANVVDLLRHLGEKVAATGNPLLPDLWNLNGDIDQAASSPFGLQPAAGRLLAVVLLQAPQAWGRTCPPATAHRS